MAFLTTDQLDPRTLEAAVHTGGTGALVTFVGTTRDNFDGKRVLELFYEAYEPMALEQLSELERSIEAAHPGAKVAMAHRLGLVPVGEASVIVAVAAPHRPAAFAACRDAIDTLKQTVAIFKQERYADGSTWKANDV